MSSTGPISADCPPSLCASTTDLLPTFQSDCLTVSHQLSHLTPLKCLISVALSDHLGGEGEFVITPVVMPQLGLEVTEGTVAAIHIAVGGRVAEGDPLLELETDKALTDVVAPRAAVLRSVDVQIGDTVAIGAT